MRSFTKTSNAYLVGLIIVMGINLVLGTFLYRQVFAQSSDYTDQKPVVVQVISEQDAPLTLSGISVDNSGKDFQTIYYSATNTSGKPVGAYVLSQKYSTGTGKAIVDYFSSFPSGTAVPNSISLERPNIPSDVRVSISIDYISFVDGTSWGPDKEGQSLRISGHEIGKNEACRYVERLLAEGNQDSVNSLLSEEISRISPSNIDTTKPEIWQKGFITGYRFSISRLKTAYEQGGIKAVSVRVKELKMPLKLEER